MRVKRISRLRSESSEVCGSNSDFVSKGDKETIIYPTCSRCGTNRMSSIPMGAHAAFKVRSSLNCGDKNEKQQPSMSFSNADAAGQPQATPPARYNSKLMNSVWGMYNRYSVHNIKSHIAYDKS